MPNGLSVCFRPIEVVLSRRRLPYVTISRLFCHTQPPFLNKAVESVYVPSNMTKAMKGAMAQKANVDPMATMNIDTLSTVLVLSTENKSSLREFRKTLDALRKKRGYQVLMERIEDDEVTYIIAHPKAGSTTEYDEMIIINLDDDEGRIVQLIGTLVAPGK